jgi:hypothetical protein
VTSKGPAGPDHKVSKDAALIIELLKKIFEFNYSHFSSVFAASALKNGLVQYCLDNILGIQYYNFLLKHLPSSILGLIFQISGGATETKSQVLNVSALTIHTVDLIKGILVACDEQNAAVLRAILAAHHAWGEYVVIFNLRLHLYTCIPMPIYLYAYIYIHLSPLQPFSGSGSSRTTCSSRTRRGRTYILSKTRQPRYLRGCSQMGKFRHE